MKNYIQNPNQKVVITFDGNQTLARIYENNKVIAKGTALCSPEDEFDLVLGSTLAMTRAVEALTPKTNTQDVEWVKVDREVRPGDYVRIVNPCFTFDRKGDVIRVTRFVRGRYGSRIAVKAKDHANRDKRCMIRGEDYIWNYKPDDVELVEARTNKDEWVVVKRDPKPGDYIRLTKKEYPFDEVGDVLKVHNVGLYHKDWVNILIDEHPKCKEYIKRETGERWIFDTWCYRNDEFEVVEPAPKQPKKPEYRKITRLPKEGDYAKIIRSCYDFDDPDLFLPIRGVVSLGDQIIGFHVLNKDHPGAMKYDREHGHFDWSPNQKWHYNCSMNTIEFYEKVEDNVETWNGMKFRKVEREVRVGDYIKLNAPFFTFDGTDYLMKVSRVSKKNGKSVPHVHHADNPGALREYKTSYSPTYEWNYWNFDDEVYECVYE